MLSSNQEQVGLIPRRHKYKGWVPQMSIIVGKHLFMLGIILSVLADFLSNHVCNQKINPAIVFLPHWICSTIAVISPFLTYYLSRGYIDLCFTDPAIQTCGKNQPSLITNVLPNLAISFVNSFVYLIFFLFSISLYYSIVTPTLIWSTLSTLLLTIGSITVFIFGITFKYQHSHELHAFGATGIIILVLVLLRKQDHSKYNYLIQLIALVFMSIYISVVSTVSFFQLKIFMTLGEIVLNTCELLVFLTIEISGIVLTLYFNNMSYSRWLVGTFIIQLLIAVVFLTFTRIGLLTYEIKYGSIIQRLELNICRKFQQLSLSPGLDYTLTQDIISSLYFSPSNILAKSRIRIKHFFVFLTSACIRLTHNLLRPSSRSINNLSTYNSQPSSHLLVERPY